MTAPDRTTWVLRWYASDESPIPRQVRCDPAGGLDENGRTQYPDTHFDTEAAAWYRMAGELALDVRSHAYDAEFHALRLEQAEARLARARDTLAAFDQARANRLAEGGGIDPVAGG